MDVHSTPHLSTIALGVLGLYVVYSIIARIVLARQRALFAARHGCQPAASLPQPLWDRMTGIGQFRKVTQAVKSHTLLDQHIQRFQLAGSNTFKLVSLSRTIHGTIEPENLKAIQATDSKKWVFPERRKSTFRMFLGNGIFNTDGAEWAHSREMLRPNFVRSQVGDLATFETHIARLIAAVPADGTTVDLSELFFRLTMDSATEFLFGESTDSLSKSSSDGFAAAFNRGQDYIMKATRLGKLNDFLPVPQQFKQDRKFVYDMVDYYVDKGLAKRASNPEKLNVENADRYVFIDELVRQTTDRTQIRSELLNILLAGRDTTASLLTNVFFILSKRPDIWAKLQTEVLTLSDSKPTFEQLKNMRYLKALLNESLRLHPVVPANSRQAASDTTLPLGGGPDGSAPLFIPKGGTVMWSLYAMHRRKDFYGEDADEFNPDRWLDDPATGKKGLRPGWEYLPFNGGPRICLGQQFALTEASYATVRLCQVFGGIESRDPGSWTEQLALTCVNAGGAKVALTRR